jgi:hypothetical protein
MPDHFELYGKQRPAAKCNAILYNGVHEGRVCERMPPGEIVRGNSQIRCFTQSALAACREIS